MKASQGKKKGMGIVWGSRSGQSLLIVVVLVVVSLTGCGSDNRADAIATASGRGVQGRVTATAAAVSLPFRGLIPATKVWQLTSDQAVDGDVTVVLPLLKPVPKRHVLVAVTAEQRNGPWLPIAARVDSTGRAVEIHTNHFSFFGALFAPIKTALKAIKEVFNGISGGALSDAAPPHCDDETQARLGGFTITSDSADTVFWCFGQNGSDRVLKVVNHRRYPLSVSHAGLTVIDAGHLDGLASLSRLGSGADTVIAPTDTVVFRVDATNGTTARLRTELDALGQSLYQLQVGVESALSLLTKFGAAPHKDATAILDTLVTTTNCAATLDDPNNGGNVIASCFGPKQILDAFGLKGLLIAPLMVAGPIVEFFRSEFNALFDQLNNRDRYHITIATPTAAPSRTLDVRALVGQWTAHASSVTIASDGNVTIKWFVNDPLASPPASGDIEVHLRITAVAGATATLVVTTRTNPPGADPNAGPGYGPDLAVGDTYMLTVQPPGIVGTASSGAQLTWCDDMHYGACGG